MLACVIRAAQAALMDMFIFGSFFCDAYTVDNGYFSLIPPDGSGSRFNATDQYNTVVARSPVECGSLCMGRHRDNGSCAGFVFIPEIRSCLLVERDRDVANISSLGQAYILTVYCPQDKGYQMVQGYCLQLFPTPVTYANARIKCQTDGAHLLFLDDYANKIDAAVQAAQPFHDTVYGFFIGLDDQATEGTYIWDYNQQTSTLDQHHPLWYYGLGPDDKNGNEDCIFIHYPSGLLDDIACSLRRPYMCEIGTGV